MRFKIAQGVRVRLRSDARLSDKTGQIPRLTLPPIPMQKNDKAIYSPEFSSPSSSESERE